MRPLALDLYCNAGGAAAGYARAGYDVVGVDIAPQSRYPFRFLQADAIEFLDAMPLGAFDLIHASPPCQHDSRMTNCRPGLAAEYPALIGPTRERLERLDIPWVIENVDGSGLPAQGDLLGANGLLLCGTMFGRELYRHRLFETSIPLPPPHHPRHLKPASKAGHWKPGTVISVEGHCSPIALAREVMGIDWMTRDELAESIPPYYTEYIGRHLIARLTRAAA